jgi:large subunit ribosomal protein L21
LDAVVRTGGKQYRVHEGSVLEVATMAVQPGDQVELREVLMVLDGGKTTVGTPTVADAVVVADVVEHGKGKKVVNFKYKAKTRYRRKKGHRQGYTKLEVTQIRIGDAPAPPRRRAAAAPVAEPEAPAAPVAPASDVEAPAAAPRRRTRAAPADAPAPAPATEAGGPASDAAPAAPARRRRTTKPSE